MNDSPPRPWPRRLRRWALLLLATYVVVLAILLALENRLVFMATPAERSWREPVDLDVEDVWMTSRDGHKLHGWWIPSPGARGAILFCHGQQGNLSHRARVMKRLQRLGMPILIFDYPGFGRSEGTPTEQGCYDSADTAFDWLVREKKIPAEEILVIGKSLGGGIATDLASRRTCRALVLVMSFTSIPDVGRRMFPFAPAGLLMRNQFDNLGKIGSCTCPVYLAHGTDDWKIPPSHSERLRDCVTSPCRYFAMDGVGHGWPCLSDECLDDLAHFLRQPPN
jgi:pimeloyl-ACP methyl ester carboxylesterase